MFAAVLDRTRAFFGIPGGSSVFSALISGRDLDARNLAVERNSNHHPSRRPSKRFALMASAVLAPAAVGMVFDPWKATSEQSALAEHRQLTSSTTVMVDHPSHTVASSVALPATLCLWQTAALHAGVKSDSQNSGQADVDRLQALNVFRLIIAPSDGVGVRRAAEVGNSGDDPVQGLQMQVGHDKSDRDVAQR